MKSGKKSTRLTVLKPTLTLKRQIEQFKRHLISKWTTTLLVTRPIMIMASMTGERLAASKLQNKVNSLSQRHISKKKLVV